MSQKLDLTSLQKALYQLDDAMTFYSSDTVQNSPRLLTHMRAAAIQAFEFSYELCWKMLKRYLEMTEPNARDIEHMSFPNLIRTGCERGLLKSDLTAWLIYRKERGATSHSYDEDKANQVVTFIPDFLLEAKYLYEQLKNRQNTKT
jgi:hypothetical protein